MAADGELGEAREAIAELRQCYHDLRRALAQVIVGQEAVLEHLATGLFCGGHLLVVGVPGLAKTLMVRGLAQALGWSFRRIQFTPDLMPSDITGTEILQSDEHGNRRALVFSRGPIFANLILADEINRTPPKTQAALLEAMQEQSVTVNGVGYPIAPPFVVVATQNPIEQEGTYPLPEAQLDRFMLSIHMDYPSTAAEQLIAARPARMQMPAIPQVSRPDRFLEFMQVLDQVPVSEQVLAQAVALVAASRPKGELADEYIRRYVAWGAGPRASQHLVTVARAHALLDGRATPELADLRAVALPVLRHRLIPNYNALGEGLDAGAIVTHLLQRLKV